ncbi:MAG: response regulator [Elusimicrobia bacterium]|nr:response regulator [Elusimicrobiota bacterium]
MKTGARILVIDDEKSIRRFMDASLTAKGYNVLLAKTGQEGIKTAAEEHPDVVILDLNLPDTDGLSVLKKIREFSQVPVMVLTVKSADADKELLLDSGADDYLIKPFSLTELLARIRVALRHSINLQEDTKFLAEVRGQHAVEQSHYLRIYISQLRRKLEAGSTELRGLIITDPGVGYRIQI